MKFCLTTISFSPHQMPLAARLVDRLGEGNVRYVATAPLDLSRKALGWGEAVVPGWVLQPGVNKRDQAQADQWADTADIVLCGNRDLGLFERRCRNNKVTLYMSERWFKPPLGVMRLLHPGYLKMAWRLLRLMHSPHFVYLPIGLHAADDMRRLISLLDRLIPVRSDLSLCGKQRLWGYFVEPSRQMPEAGEGGSAFVRECESALVGGEGGGRRAEDGKRSAFVRECESALVGVKGDARTEDRSERTEWRSELVGEDGGVDGSSQQSTSLTNERTHSRTHALRILWFGRLLAWKRTDLLIDAVKRLNAWPGPPVTLRIVGCGAEEAALKRKVSGLNLDTCVEFIPAKPINEIRSEIRATDVCVITSNAQEGWGVAVNEAMIEGRCVIASAATGAGATLIENGVNGLLFKSGDGADLVLKLQSVREDLIVRERLAAEARTSMLAEWTPAVAAERLIEFSESLLAVREFRHWESGPLSCV